jgi:hypothetical protein
MEISIFGIQLRDSLESFRKTLRSEPDKIERPGDGLEVWSWKSCYDRPQSPLFINLIDGRVSEISGCQLTFQGEEVNHMSSYSEILQRISILQPEQYTSVSSLKWDNGGISLSAIVNPGRNKFYLYDHIFAQEWAERMVPVLNSKE